MLPKRRKPTHPGEILSEEFLKPLQLTSRELAEKLGEGWSEVRIQALISGRENLSEHGAQEFASVLGMTPQFWKHLWQTYTQWEQTQQQHKKGSLKPWKKAQ